MTFSANKFSALLLTSLFFMFADIALSLFALDIAIEIISFLMLASSVFAINIVSSSNFNIPKLLSLLIKYVNIPVILIFITLKMQDENIYFASVYFCYYSMLLVIFLKGNIQSTFVKLLFYTSMALLMFGPLLNVFLRTEAYLDPAWIMSQSDGREILLLSSLICVMIAEDINKPFAKLVSRLANISGILIFCISYYIAIHYELNVAPTGKLKFIIGSVNVSIAMLNYYFLSMACFYFLTNRK